MKKLFCAVVVCIGAGAVSAQSSNRPEVLTSGNARYVFGQISEFSRHQYLLDTQTGRLWQLVQAGPNKPDGTIDKDKAYSVLDPIPYTDMGGKLSLTPPGTK